MSELPNTLLRDYPKKCTSPNINDTENIRVNKCYMRVSNFFNLLQIIFMSFIRNFSVRVTSRFRNNLFH